MALMVLGVCVVVVMTVGLYAVTRAITSRSYERLERRDVGVAIERAERAVAHRVDDLSQLAADYATWDDTHSFVQGTYPEYPDDHLLPDSMATIGVDFMAVVDPDDRTAVGRAVDTSGRPSELPSYLADIVESGQLAQTYDPSVRNGSGIITTDRGPLLFATHPITRSDGSESLRSFLIVGRLLDVTELDAMSRLTRLPIAVFASDEDPALPVGVSSAVAHTTLGSTTAVPLSSEHIAGYRHLPDFAGHPALLLGVTIPRTIHQAGIDASRWLAFSLVVFGVVSTAGVANALHRQHREVVVRTNAERHARTSEQRYRELIEHMADAVLCIDASGHITYANSRAAGLTGVKTAELTGQSYARLLSADSLEPAQRHLSRTLERGASESFEVEISCARGGLVPAEVGSSPMIAEDGSVHGAQWIVRDVTDRKRVERELVHLANRDHLTGLYNRRSFEEELDNQVEHVNCSGGHGAVLWFDLDNFKDINDSLGHGAGDEVLAGLARSLKERLRADSMLARIGGDEFAVLLPIATEADAAGCAQRLVDDIGECLFRLDGRSVRVTASVGVVVFPDHASTAEEILSRADLAMYRAKDVGHGQYCIYRPDEHWHAELQARFDASAQIEDALHADRFVVYVQPVLDLASGEIHRHELLIRMEDADGSLIMPGEFLPVAERTGQIAAIDRWMVRRAIDLISMRTGPNDPCRLDVNLSGRAFDDTGLLPLIESELIRTGIDPSLLGIEITETAAVSDIGRAREFIETLKHLGCRVALDDFGSGFSSFYYLRNLPVDCLKIDGTFVQNMSTNEQDQHVVRAIVELAAGFGIKSTAEFVEDGLTLELLRQYGVTYAQGFHVARPHPSWDERRPDEAASA